MQQLITVEDEADFAHHHRSRGLSHRVMGKSMINIV